MGKTMWKCGKLGESLVENCGEDLEGFWSRWTLVEWVLVGDYGVKVWGSGGLLRGVLGAFILQSVSKKTTHDPQKIP